MATHAQLTLAPAFEIDTTAEDALLGGRNKSASGAAAIAQAVGGGCVDSSFSVGCDNGEGALNWEKTKSYETPPAHALCTLMRPRVAPRHFKGKLARHVFLRDRAP